MDCRNFHRLLEDYLEDGLDFAGRFGMERHAQQCIRCGKDLASAQGLRRMVREIDHVRTPDGFEAAVLDRIAAEKSPARFSPRRYWIYGFEWPSPRRLALASSAVALLGFGVFYMTSRPAADLAPAAAVKAPAPIVPVGQRDPAIVPAPATKPVPGIGRSAASGVQMSAAAGAPERSPRRHPEVSILREDIASAAIPDAMPVAYEPEPQEADYADYTDYVEYQVVGPDDHPVRLRWPVKSRTRYGKSPEEYFLQNVSH